MGPAPVWSITNSAAGYKGEVSVPRTGDIIQLEWEMIMAELQLTLTDEERTFLADLLETALKETLVEEHRTRTLSYRELVQRQEHLIAQLLDKIRQAPR
jgi:hypothetical protein